MYILANMFSHTMGSLFILTMGSLAVKKLFNLIQSHLIIFPLFSVPKEIYQQEYCSVRYLKFYCLCFLLGFLWFHDSYLSLLSILSSLFVEHYLTIETWVYFWAFNFVPLIYVSVFMPVPECFDYSGLIVQFYIRYYDPSNFVILSQDC